MKLPRLNWQSRVGADIGWPDVSVYRWTVLVLGLVSRTPGDFTSPLICPSFTRGPSQACWFFALFLSFINNKLHMAASHLKPEQGILVGTCGLWPLENLKAPLVTQGNFRDNCTESCGRNRAKHSFLKKVHCSMKYWGSEELQSIVVVLCTFCLFCCLYLLRICQI